MEVRDYHKGVTEALSKVNLSKVDALAREIERVAGLNGVVYVAGNGGSASLADHFACDLGFVVGEKTDGRVKVHAVSLASSIATLTALSNDKRYSSVFKHHIKYMSPSRDLLVLISTSGTSPNIRVAALEARVNNISTFALLGPTGGSIKNIVEDFILVEADHPSMVEDVHLFICHAVTIKLMRGV